MAVTELKFRSLERKLPILIGGLVAGALLITLLVVRYELQHSALDAAEERLDLVSQQLADVVDNSVAARVRLLQDVARSDAVVAFAARAALDEPALRRQLERLRTAPADSALPVQVRTRDGRIFDARSSNARLELPTETAPADVPLGDSVLYSPLTRSRDGFTYWTSAPVRANGQLVGHVVQQRGVHGGGSGEIIEQLLGSGIQIYFANEGGSQWAALADGRVADAPPLSPHARRAHRVTFEGNDIFVLARPLQHTQWMLVAQMPVAGIFARPDAVVRRLIAVSALLLLLGGVAAWLLSRTVTAPLRRLRTTADALAAGDYSRRTRLQRDDEIGRVARSFDDMADRIDESHAQLALQFSEARSLARELEHANLLLNTAVREADSARHEAQQANRAKSEFLATMSHEIRTPINAVVGYTDLMQLQLPGPLTEQQRDYVDRIRRSAEHLTSLVNDVLDFAKVESGQMRITRDILAAADVVDTSISMLQNAATEKSIRIQRDCAATVTFVGDAQRVHQILINLLSNAIKFTDAGGLVRISCGQRESRPSAAGPQQRWTCIIITDTGAGIATDQIDTIFEPFVQGSSGYTRPHGGTGLGLAISRSLARMMDGDITVESHPGRGSTFTLWLPTEPFTPLQG